MEERKDRCIRYHIHRLHPVRLAVSDNGEPRIYDTSLPLHFYQEEIGFILFVISLFNHHVPQKRMKDILEAYEQEFHVIFNDYNDPMHIASTILTQVLEDYQVNRDIYALSKDLDVDSAQSDLGIQVLYSAYMRVFYAMWYTVDDKDKIEEICTKLLPIVKLSGVNSKMIANSNVKNIDTMFDGGEMCNITDILVSNLFEVMMSQFINYCQFKIHREMLEFNRKVEPFYEPVMEIIDKEFSVPYDEIMDVFTQALMNDNEKEKYIIKCICDLNNRLIEIDIKDGKFN